jgi:DNA-binding transcriptional regulator YiaG
MTPTRLRECLDALEWTQRGLARTLQKQEGTVRQWARGQVRIPEDVAAWLEILASFHARHPPPAPSRAQSPEIARSG